MSPIALNTMPKLRIFFTGATGYIGGSVLTRLLEHPKRDTFDITILIRAASKVKAFEFFGLNVVVGSLDDADLLERLAYESDIVFQSADSDHLPATKAILRGLKKRFGKTKKPPIIIQTSGTGAMIDSSPGGTTYSDLDVEEIDAIPVTNPHRPVDTTIVAADKEGYVKGYLVLPSVVWGVADNALTAKGLQHPISVLLPFVIGTGIKRGLPMTIGEGNNKWPHIHIDELADFYEILFNSIISEKNVTHGREGFYIIENGAYAFHDVCNAVGKVLHELGKTTTAIPAELTDEEKASVAWVGILAFHCRAIGERSRALGWSAVKGTDDFIASIRSEAEYLLKENLV